MEKMDVLVETDKAEVEKVIDLLAETLHQHRICPVQGMLALLEFYLRATTMMVQGASTKESREKNRAEILRMLEDGKAYVRGLATEEADQRRLARKWEEFELGKMMGSGEKAKVH